MSQTPPGEPDVVPVQLLVFRQMHLVLVDCTEAGCAWHRASGFGESSVLHVDMMVHKNYVCKTLFCRAGKKQGEYQRYRKKKPDITERFLLIFYCESLGE